MQNGFRSEKHSNVNKKRGDISRTKTKFLGLHACKSKGKKGNEVGSTKPKPEPDEGKALIFDLQEICANFRIVIPNRMNGSKISFPH